MTFLIVFTKIWETKDQVQEIFWLPKWSSLLELQSEQGKLFTNPGSSHLRDIYSCLDSSYPTTTPPHPAHACFLFWNEKKPSQCTVFCTDCLLVFGRAPVLWIMHLHTVLPLCELNPAGWRWLSYSDGKVTSSCQLCLVSSEKCSG